MGSSLLRASARPALAPWPASGVKRMVAPSLPPVLDFASYEPVAQAFCKTESEMVQRGTQSRDKFIEAKI